MLELMSKLKSVSTCVRRIEVQERPRVLLYSVLPGNAPPWEMHHFYIRHIRGSILGTTAPKAHLKDIQIRNFKFIYCSY